MIFKNLYVNIVIRVILITATSFLFFFAYQKYHDIIININIVVLLVIQVALLIRRLNFINRDLIAFFDSLQYDDSSVLLVNEFQDINYLRLSRRLQIVNRQILKLKEQNAKQDQYFRTITEIAKVGLLSFNREGTVKLANKALKELFYADKISHIKDLDKFHPGFSELLLQLKPSEHKVVKVNIREELLYLSLRLTDFNTKDDRLKIVSVQDIKNELDQKELESWQKLVRILRHEIMNSISPISSTIETLDEIITDPETQEPLNVQKVSNELMRDISSGLKIIQERNNGLQKFVDSFRTISKLPHPVFEKIDLENLFRDINLFWKKEFEKQNIRFDIQIEDNAKELTGDKSQVEQIIINLIKNSMEAESTKISLRAYEDMHDKTVVEIADNGTGIPEDIIDEIFLPFYTTKEQGSGIGLSLARQIMRLHGGTISVVSVPGNVNDNKPGETVFSLVF